jgi:hypothetical protein
MSGRQMPGVRAPSDERKLRRWLNRRWQRDSIGCQNGTKLLRRWFNGWWQWHSVGSLHDAELRGRLNRRWQGHTIRDVAISPANSACKPTVDRNCNGKYD